MFLENHFQETFIDTFLVHVIFRIAASELWWRLSGINLRTLSDTTHTHTRGSHTSCTHTHTHTSALTQVIIQRIYFSWFSHSC